MLLLLTLFACSKDQAIGDDTADCVPTVEICNGLDDNCDGVIDEGVLPVFFADVDGDGFGDPGAPLQECEVPQGYVQDSTDCDDTSLDVNPAGFEVCSGRDDDCDGLVDDEDDSVDTDTRVAWYADADGDSYGDQDIVEWMCSAPTGFVDRAGDCDDDVPTSFPDADEFCDGADNNCDGEIDEDTAVDVVTWYADTDGDTYGDLAYASIDCEQPQGYVSIGGDCDDSSASIYPGVEELCDTVDNNCDGNVDEDSALDVLTWYVDADGDDYGDSTVTDVDCDQPTGYVLDDTDCDDAVAATNPGAGEVCNDGLDDDCDGYIDEDSAVDASTWYEDTDGDGFGNASSSDVDCSQPTGYVLSGDDCDDADATVHPSATETCNGVDDDCDSSTSEDGTASWVPTGGSETDLTSDVSGTSESPAEHALSNPGTLTFCDGTFYVHLDIEEDVTVIGLNGASTTILDGGDSGSIIEMWDGYDVELEGLTLQAGGADDSSFLWDSVNYSGGGAIACAGDTNRGELLVRDSTLTGNNGDLGGAFSLQKCDATFDSVTMDDNSATYGGAGFVNDSTVEFDGCLVESNSATDHGGAIYIYESAVSCDGSGGDYGFSDNSALVGEAIYSSDSTSTLDVSRCDFGVVLDANDSGDVDLVWNGGYYESANDATFDCDSNGCGTAAGPDSIGGATASVNSPVVGNVFLATSDSSLESFSGTLSAEIGCQATPYVVSASSLGSRWNIEWIGSTVADLTTTSAVYESGDVFVALKTRTYYAFVWSSNCGSYIHHYYESGVASTDLGTLKGYMRSSSELTGGVGDVVTLSHTSGTTSVLASTMEFTLME